MNKFNQLVLSFWSGPKWSHWAASSLIALLTFKQEKTQNLLSKIGFHIHSYFSYLSYLHVRSRKYKLQNENMNKNSQNLKLYILKVSYKTDMAKVRPAGRMRPSNLFFRPLDLFLLCRKTTHIFYQDKFSQKLYILLLKRTNFFLLCRYYYFKISFLIVRPEMKFFF